MKLLTFIVLDEELKDIPTHNVLIHNTNLTNLYNILKTGVLRGSAAYSSMASSREEPVEIAVSRKSTGMKKLSDIRKLSGEAGGIEILIFRDRLSSNKLRGVKVKAINEYVKGTKELIIKRLKSLDVDKPEKIFNLLLKIYSNSPKKFAKNAEEELDDKVYKKIHGNLESFFIILKRYFNYIKNREFEERIDVTKNNKYLPLDSDYLKIIINPEEVKDYKEFFGDVLTNDYINDFLKLLKKYSNNGILINTVGKKELEKYFLNVLKKHPKEINKKH